jgi:hypothetical protein
MKQQINEVRRMQQLAGLINENQETTTVEKIENTVADKLENSVEKLTDEQIAQLQQTLSSLGITADSNPQDVINKLEPKINEILGEAEGDTQKKVADALGHIGTGLVKSLLIPLIPLAVGHEAGIGFAGGLAATIGVAGLLIGLAKALGHKENSTETGNN